MAFPSNPNNGDTYIRYGRTYQYDSTMLMWKVLKSGILLEELADIDITTNPPTAGDALLWSGSTFEPGTVGAVKVYQTNLPLSGNSAGDIAYVTDLSRLYMFTGVGWFNIALINTNPTITTGPDGSYAFATDGTPTVITLVAEDPEGVPITWSYAVTTGSLGTTATVAQADNVFTITPSTNSADQGNFGITFTASDGVNLATTGESSFTLAFNAPIEYLVVAGGGGGGGKISNNAYGGGGAGAGGFRTATGFLVDFGSAITVTVGAGGAGGIGVQGSSGFDSVFSTITSNGGGYGAKGSVSASAEVGGAGGSGGAGTYLALGGAGIAGQGFKGGTDSNGTGGGSPGGGGAGAQGVDITSGQLGGSAGGAGLYSSISGTNIAYAGGGGGGAYGVGGAGGLGGAGGGGNGGTSGVGPAEGTGPGGTGNGGNGLDGSTNLGGGGGGSFSTANAALGIGGEGGSGVVIVRYLGETQATGGTITSSGGYTIHTFTSSGVFST
jgi:hypothetical protein